MAKITVSMKMDEAVWRALRHAAIDDDMDFGAWAESAIMSALEAHEKEVGRPAPEWPNVMKKRVKKRA
ncbi:MAG: hypothetical protein OK452_04310 [Thaumarchaeota archaeon]|nr:hypothetical protein [Nitrososphaerota archaeon]